MTRTVPAPPQYRELLDRDEPGIRDWVALAPPAAAPTLKDLARLSPFER